MRIIFFGTPTFVIPILEILQKHFNVVGVITAPDHWDIRKKKHIPSPVKQQCIVSASHIPVFSPEKPSSITSQLSSLKPDIFIVAAYGKIIPQNLLDVPVYGAINIHPSILPKYRGPSPLTETILQGDTQTGISFMKMDKEMDHGPLLRIIPQEVHPTDTFETLANHLFGKAATLLPEIITDYTEGRLLPKPQDDSAATYTSHITKQDGYIDLNAAKNLNQMEIDTWKMALDRKIRAYYPWPTAWTKIRMKNKEVRIKLLPDKKLQIEGKTPVSAKDILRDYPEIKKRLGYLFEDEE